MRRHDKGNLPPRIQGGLRYAINGDNTELRELLTTIQLNTCAYTETFLGRTELGDIDHFNPKLKGTEEDGYQNWYVIKSQWNREKSGKWDQYQPILYPDALDLEDRIGYFDGDYIATDSNDRAAVNLIRLLKLDDPDLAKERKNYISRKRDEIANSGLDAQEYFRVLLNSDINGIKFVRAIRLELNPDIENQLSAVLNL